MKNKNSLKSLKSNKTRMKSNKNEYKRTITRKTENNKNINKTNKNRTIDNKAENGNNKVEDGNNEAEYENKKTEDENSKSSNDIDSSKNENSTNIASEIIKNVNEFEIKLSKKRIFKILKYFLALVGLFFIISTLFSLVGFGLRINMLLFGDVLIKIDPVNINILAENREPENVSFNILIDNRIFCEALCEYKFVNLLNNDILDTGNFFGQNNKNISLNYQINIPDRGSGQLAYEMSVECNNKKSFFCRTDERVRQKSSFLTLSYEMSEEEREKMQFIKSSIEKSFEALTKTDKNIQEITSKVEIFSEYIDLKDIEKEQNLIKTNFPGLIINFNYFKEMWNTENYLEIYDEVVSFEDKTNALLEKSIFILEKVDTKLSVLKQTRKSLSFLLNNIFLLKQNQKLKYINNLTLGEDIKQFDYETKLFFNQSFNKFVSEYKNFIDIFNKNEYISIEEYNRQINFFNINFLTRYLTEFEIAFNHLSLGIQKSENLIDEMNSQNNNNNNINNNDSDENNDKNNINNNDINNDENDKNNNINNNDNDDNKINNNNLVNDSIIYFDSELFSEYFSSFSNKSLERYNLTTLQETSTKLNEMFSANNILFSEESDNFANKLNFSFRKLINDFNMTCLKINNILETYNINKGNETEMNNNQTIEKFNSTNIKILELKEYYGMFCKKINVLSYPKKDHLNLEITISDIPVYEHSEKVSNLSLKLKEHSQTCCVFDICEPCCTDDCSERKINYPLLLIHGHAFSKESAVEHSLFSLNQIRRRLVSDGFIDGGVVLPTSSIDIESLNEYFVFRKPVVFMTTYYLDQFETDGVLHQKVSKTDKIDTYAERLNSVIEKIKFKTGYDKVNIVAYSMGGLVARKYIVDFGESSVNNLIMIATPNKGIERHIESFCSIAGAENECIQMSSNSNFINELNNVRNIPRTVRNFVIYGSGCLLSGLDSDGIVIVRNTKLDYSLNFEIKGNCTEKLLHEEIKNIEAFPSVYQIIRNILRN